MNLNRIKQLREELNIGQKVISHEIGVSQSVISAWERGERNPSKKNAEKLARMFNVSVRYLLGENDQFKSGVKIPVLGRVAAGLPIEAIEDIMDWEEITPELAQRGTFFALKIRGDSMEPLIMDGDIVIVRQQPEAQSGDICILCVNGEDATCKKIQNMENGIMVIPNNPTHLPVFFDKKSIDKITIIGIVIEVRRRLNNRF